jgi:hypothetical protein
VRVAPYGWMQYTNKFRIIPTVACLQVDKGVKVGRRCGAG